MKSNWLISPHVSMMLHGNCLWSVAFIFFPCFFLTSSEAYNSSFYRSMVKHEERNENKTLASWNASLKGKASCFSTVTRIWKLLNAYTSRKAREKVSSIWQSLCAVTCAALVIQQRSTVMVGQDSLTKSASLRDALVCPMRDGRMDGWYQSSGRSWQLQFLSATSAASASVSFTNLFWSASQCYLFFLTLLATSYISTFQSADAEVTSGRWCLALMRRHPPDFSLNLKGWVMSQHEECEMLEWGVWLIGVSASSWGLHAEKLSLAARKRIGFIKTSRRWWHQKFGW